MTKNDIASLIPAMEPLTVAVRQAIANAAATKRHFATAAASMRVADRQLELLSGVTEFALRQISILYDGLSGTQEHRDGPWPVVRTVSALAEPSTELWTNTLELRNRLAAHQRLAGTVRGTCLDLVPEHDRNATTAGSALTWLERVANAHYRQLEQLRHPGKIPDALSELAVLRAFEELLEEWAVEAVTPDFHITEHPTTTDPKGPLHRPLHVMLQAVADSSSTCAARYRAVIENVDESVQR